MAKSRRTKRKPTEWKSAFLTLAGAELGRHGTRGGKTAMIDFFDGRGKKLGELRISASRVRWWGVRDKKPIMVSARDMDDLFWRWHTR